MITVKQRLVRRVCNAFAGLAIAAWVNGATLADASRTGSSEAKARETELVVSEIRAGVFMHSGVHADIDEHNLGDIANIGFIAGDRSVAVIDPGASPAIATALQSTIARLTGLPVSHVILTHLHPDHVLGAAAFPGSAQRIAHEHYPRAVLQRGAFYLDRYAELLGIDSTALDLPDLLVPTGENITIDLGGRMLSVRAYPVSHTDNDLTVHDSMSGVLWASDLVFETRIPSLDGSLTGWLSTLDELEQRFAGSLVIPGHGDPGPLAPIVARQRRYLQSLADEVRAGISHNMRLSVAVEQIGRKLKTQWQLHELHHRGNVSKAWNELEWE